jgi:hypothetical protein
MHRKRSHGSTLVHIWPALCVPLVGNRQAGVDYCVSLPAVQCSIHLGLQSYCNLITTQMGTCCGVLNTSSCTPCATKHDNNSVSCCAPEGVLSFQGKNTNIVQPLSKGKDIFPTGCTLSSFLSHRVEFNELGHAKHAHHTDGLVHASTGDTHIPSKGQRHTES